jgi:hypothetical protein
MAAVPLATCLSAAEWLKGSNGHLALSRERRLRSSRIPEFDGDFLVMKYKRSISVVGPDRVETQEVGRTVNFCVYMPFPASLRASGQARLFVHEMVLLQEECSIKWYVARLTTT